MNKTEQLGQIIFAGIFIVVVLFAILLTVDDANRHNKLKQKCSTHCIPKSYYFREGNMFEDDICECDSWRANNEQKIVVVRNE